MAETKPKLERLIDEIERAANRVDHSVDDLRSCAEAARDHFFETDAKRRDLSNCAQLLAYDMAHEDRTSPLPVLSIQPDTGRTLALWRFAGTPRVQT